MSCWSTKFDQFRVDRESFENLFSLHMHDDDSLHEYEFFFKPGAGERLLNISVTFLIPKIQNWNRDSESVMCLIESSTIISWKICTHVCLRSHEWGLKIYNLKITLQDRFDLMLFIQWFPLSVIPTWKLIPERSLFSNNDLRLGNTARRRYFFMHTFLV